MAALAIMNASENVVVHWADLITQRDPSEYLWGHEDSMVSYGSQIFGMT